MKVNRFTELSDQLLGKFYKKNSKIILVNSIDYNGLVNASTICKIREGYSEAELILSDSIRNDSLIVYSKLELSNSIQENLNSKNIDYANFESEVADFSGLDKYELVFFFSKVYKISNEKSLGYIAVYDNAANIKYGYMIELFNNHEYEANVLWASKEDVDLSVFKGKLVR